MGNSASAYTTTSACLSAATAGLMGLKMMAREPAMIHAPSINNDVAAPLVSRDIVCTIAPKNPFPAAFHCGASGTLLRPSNLTLVDNVASANDCGTVCFQTKGCISFAYTDASQECQLLNKVLNAQKYVNRTMQTGTEYYHRNCFGRTCQDVNTCQSVILTNPTTSHNDDYWSQALPFSVSAYGFSSSNIQISNNGWVGLDSSGYCVFPSPPFGAFPDSEEAIGSPCFKHTIAPFWTDQKVAAVTDYSQIIALQTNGFAPNRVLQIIWKTTDSSTTQTYSYSVSYAENTPGVWTVGWNGFSGSPTTAALTGFEGPGSGQYYNWEYSPGGTFALPALPFNITFNTNTNTATPSGPS